MTDNYFIFFNAEGKAQHLAYNVNPEVVEHMLMPGQTAFQVEDPTGWELLTLGDVTQALNREQTVEDANG